MVTANDLSKMTSNNSKMLHSGSDGMWV
jgi:hypothetical protein